MVVNNNFINRATTAPFYFSFRIIYIAMVPVTMSLLINPSMTKMIKKEEQPRYKKYYYILSILIIVGTIQIPQFHYYNILFFPFILFLHLMVASRAFAKIGEKLVSDRPLENTSQKPLGPLGLVFQVKNNYGVEMPLHVHNPFQGIMVQGGAGSGKSGSIFEPGIYQWVKQNACMLIYDFKGNPATLGLFAYNTWLETPNSADKPSFELVSFNDLYISSRPNPLSPKVLKSSLQTKTVTDTLMIALNRDWASKKTEFFTASGLNLCHAIAERLRRDPMLHPYCTIPHLIALATCEDETALLHWLADDEEIRPIIASFMTPLKRGAETQLAGQVSSLTNGLAIMGTPEISWILGAELEKQTSLDLNSITDPRIMCIANDPVSQVALSPIISAIVKSALTIMNQQGKRPSVVPIDELPTLYIDGLSEIPATSRSNQLALLIGIQDESQLIGAYNKQADEITSNMGTFFIGMTNNPKTAKKYSDFFGTYEKVKGSNTVSNDSLSIAESHQDKKILQDREIAEQPLGHFIGKVANGSPAMFSVQFMEFKKNEHFKNWKNKIEIEIPDPEVRNIFENDLNAEDTFKDLIELNHFRIRLESLKILKPYMS